MKMTRQINAALLIAALSLTAAGCSARADMSAITGNMGSPAAEQSGNSKTENVREDIDLNAYVDVYISGYNGVGLATIEFNNSAFIADNNAAISSLDIYKSDDQLFNNHVQETVDGVLGLKTGKTFEIIDNLVSLKAEQTNYLSNGDFLR